MPRFPVSLSVISLLLAGVGLSGCSQGEPTTGSPPTGSPAATATARAERPSASAPISAGSVEAGDRSTAGTSDGSLLDGRHPAKITHVDPTGRQVTIDVVQFFLGDAATEAARLDGAAEVPPPNDYWIRNESPRLRSLPVAGDAPVMVNTLTAHDPGNEMREASISLSHLASYGETRISYSLFWVTTSGGTVTDIAEQFLP